MVVLQIGFEWLPFAYESRFCGFRLCEPCGRVHVDGDDIQMKIVFNILILAVSSCALVT